MSTSKSGNESFFHSFAENPPEEKKPSSAMHLSTNCLKSAFRAYLLDKKVRNEILSARKDAYETSLLTVDINFEYVVNMNLAEAVLKYFFLPQYLVLEQDRLKKILLIVYVEFCRIKNLIEVDDFFEKEIERFVKTQIQKQSLISEQAEMLARFQPKKNSHIQHCEIVEQISMTDGASKNTNQAISELKYPQKCKKLFNSKPTACKGSSIASDRLAVHDQVDLFLKSLALPKTSSESTKQPGMKYPQTSDKFSSCKPTTMEVNTDLLNETKKQE
ncbi:hypothetical protein TNCV_61531 [Trichonephila clavipes]|nr:hypothetical protein TNCV_61531 [Trichonephila clavipes]